MKFLSIYLIAIFINCLDAQLQLVHVIFRHGSRTPELKDIYPTDPFNSETFTPMGYGALTNRGKNMSFKLGQLLRQKYDYFLGDIYTSDVVKAYSTDFDRTKMTALLALAGLFPPSKSQKFNDNLAWMPIPYHYDKDKYDYTLRRPNAYCPAYMKELEEVLSSEEVQREIKANRDFFKYIAEKTKKPMNTLGDVFGVYQTLNAEESMNLTLPEWAQSVYPEQLHAMAAKQCNYENYNTVLKRLNGGRMLGQIIKQMSAKSRNLLREKIFLYSGHENNVINILAALNLFKPHVPKYSAAVIVELYQNGVKVLYLRDVTSEPEVQKLEGCDVLCPLDDFIRITRPHVPGNYTAECHSHVNLD
ncbi:venom acid phosphatase Acph-1-like isoform X1 [Tribolium madens]|uniref:venom acid phosphatase Acph-1-like isoform X1 n=2 Tax=Tribolium madens TaxID=41895 RepID=UPI001CF721AF|nr:venom acid phosphatase Acph-1-like isoform X1 [Tribolium madens]